MFIRPGGPVDRVPAVTAGNSPPGWAAEALTELPAIMVTAHQRQNALERAIVDFTEAVVLGP